MRLAKTIMGFGAFLLIGIAVTLQASAQQPGRLINNVCQPVDPPKEPRSLVPAAADAVIQLTLDPSGSGVPNLLFNLVSITVNRGSLRVGFQFADESIGVSNPVSARIEPGDAEAPQTWGFPGVSNINRLTLEAIIGNVFEVDDIVIEPADGGGALTINFDDEASLRAIPRPFTDAREAKANRYQEDGVVVLASVNPQDSRLGGSPQTFYYLRYPSDVIIPCVPATVADPMPIDLCAKKQSDAEDRCKSLNPPQPVLGFSCSTGEVLFDRGCGFDCPDLQATRENECRDEVGSNFLLRDFVCELATGITKRGDCVLRP